MVRSLPTTQPDPHPQSGSGQSWRFLRQRAFLGLWVWRRISRMACWTWSVNVIFGVLRILFLRSGFAVPVVPLFVSGLRCGASMAAFNSHCTPGHPALRARAWYDVAGLMNHRRE